MPRLTSILLIATVLTILLLTLLPDGHQSGNGAHRIKWIPLNHFTGWSCVIDECNLRPAKIRSQLLDLFGNITLFIPFGLFFYLAIAAKYPTRISSGQVIWIGLLFSGLIELMQLGLPSRTPDIDDIIFNSSGTWLGVRLAVILLTTDPPKIVGMVTFRYFKRWQTNAR